MFLTQAFIRNVLRVNVKNICVLRKTNPDELCLCIFIAPY